MATDSDEALQEDEVKSAAFPMEVGIETALRERIVTKANVSKRNLYALSLLSNASYFSGDALLSELCNIGIHARGTAPCAPETKGSRASLEAELATFDTYADDHAIYLSMTVPGRAGPKDVGILAFRGTASIANAITDLRLWRIDRWGRSANTPDLENKDLPGAVHEGIQLAASRLWRGDTPDQSLRQFILDRHAKPDAPPLYLTGHSLGAALATVTAGFLFFGECSSIDANETFHAPREANPEELAWSLPGTSCPRRSSVNIKGLYTYGSPRFGDRYFAEATGNMLALRGVAHFRVVNGNDIVTRLGPRYWGYSHLVLNIEGLSENFREYALREDESADSYFGARPASSYPTGHCRQWKDLDKNPETCPTLSLVYLSAPGKGGRDPSDVLRVGAGATEALDAEATYFGRASDHAIDSQYIPLLRMLLPDP